MTQPYCYNYSEQRKQFAKNLMRNKGIKLVFALVLLLINSPSVFAQSSTATLTEDDFPTNEQNPNGSSFGNSFNPLDLIHRANMSNGRDAEEFNQDSSKNIKDAAAEFKRLQMQRLNNQQSENSDSKSNVQ